MKTLLRALPLLVASFAVAAGGFLYHDASGNMSLSAQSGSLVSGASIYTFHLRGGVTASSRKDGLVITAMEVVGDALPAKQETHIRHAVATGGARVVKTSTSGTSTLSSMKADYTDRGRDALVVMTGGVRITSVLSAKRQSWVITGPSGEATLDPAGSKGKGLRSAIIDGGARVQLDQATGGSMVATGRRLVLDNSTKPATLTLTGSVRVQGGSGTGFGSLQNAQRAVLRLNEKGEVVSTEVSS